MPALPTARTMMPAGELYQVGALRGATAGLGALLGRRRAWLPLVFFLPLMAIGCALYRAAVRSQHAAAPAELLHGDDTRQAEEEEDQRQLEDDSEHHHHEPDEVQVCVGPQ